ANGKEGQVDVEQLPDVMLQGLDKVQLNNTDALICDSYKSYLYFHVTYYTSAANGFKKFNDFSTASERKIAYAKAHLKGQPFNLWLAQLCVEERDRVSPFMLRSMISTLKTSDKLMDYYPYVSNLCAKQMSLKEDKKKDPGKPDPEENEIASKQEDLGMKDVNGKTFTMSELKGKVVYIDFWASWCGPCRRQMPFSKQLHDGLTDKQKKDIVFLYISIDADENNWKKAMTDLGMEGKQVISPGNWGSKICKYFQIY